MTAANLSERLSGAAECTHQLLHALRDIIWASHPAADTVEGLAGRLSEFSTRFLGAAALRCRLDFPLDLPAFPLSPQLRRDVLLATREALNNVVRHAQAREVRLRLRIDHQTLRLAITDDGCGFDVTQTSRNRGLGLASMRERIEALGGSIGIESVRERGTTIQLTVPLHSQRQSRGGYSGS